jgi:hypothetical protein
LLPEEKLIAEELETIAPARKAAFEAESGMMISSVYCNRSED